MNNTLVNAILLLFAALLGRQIFATAVVDAQPTALLTLDPRSQSRASIYALRTIRTRKCIFALVLDLGELEHFVAVFFLQLFDTVVLVPINVPLYPPMQFVLFILESSNPIILSIILLGSNILYELWLTHGLFTVEEGLEALHEPLLLDGRIGAVEVLLLRFRRFDLAVLPPPSLLFDVQRRCLYWRVVALLSPGLLHLAVASGDLADFRGVPEFSGFDYDCASTHFDTGWQVCFFLG